MILIVDQVYIFLYAIICGAIVAFFYDILRIKRRAIKTNIIIVNLEDITYWLVAAVFLFITVYKSNSGEMRGFIFIGNIIGVMFYGSIFSKIVIASSVRVINIIKRILIFSWNILSYPFKLLFKILMVPISFTLKWNIKLLKLLIIGIKDISINASGFAKNGLKKIPSISKKLRKALKNT